MAAWTESLATLQEYLHGASNGTIRVISDGPRDISSVRSAIQGMQASPSPHGEFISPRGEGVITADHTAPKTSSVRAEGRRSARDGLFPRGQLVQGRRTFTFRDLQALEELAPASRPSTTAPAPARAAYLARMRADSRLRRRTLQPEDTLRVEDLL